MRLQGEAEAFYAHSTSRADKSNWQLLRSHLHEVAERAGRHASVFGAEPLARLAGLLHDLGKYTHEFQLRLSGEHGRLDHATWGARIAQQRYGPIGNLLAYCIAGHHAGLANGAEAGKRTALQDRLGDDPKFDLAKVWEQEIALPSISQVSDLRGFRAQKGQSSFQLSLMGRMIFSCLVDADYLDTEKFYEGNERKASLASLGELHQRLNGHLARFAPNSDVNTWRAEILRHVRQQASQAPGLFSLTVPTGGGKTLASLAFALDHAITHGLRRIIYVIPFTSIVEQNAAVFREALGDLGDDAVLEHHSAFAADEDTRRERGSRDKLHQAMENWDAPIVVTTAVQFFESLFADRPSRCRKLHNIAGSVVILDEAQTLPTKLLRPCVAALDELALNYRTSVVLCTATQPALTAEEGFRGGFEYVRELAPEPKALYQKFRRVTVRHIGTVPQERLTELMNGQEQALCIVNNRRHARALYESIAEQPGARHLSTLMCAQHRAQVLSEVRQRLRKGEPCRLVATSLIEAGVDVDFPLVLRCEAGLDSIAQAAGRCNREGRRRPEQSEVLVFATEGEEWAPPPELKQFAQVFREIHRKHAEDPLSLDAVCDYFRQLYWQKGPDELDSKDLLGLLERSRIESLPFETVASKFRMIENAQLPIIVPFNEKVQDLLTQLDFAEKCGGIARKLQRYLVPVPRQGYEALRGAGAIRARGAERFGEQFMELINPDLYSDRFGLSWDEPSFIKTESLLW